MEPKATDYKAELERIFEKVTLAVVPA
jgi:hypothetical protein